MPTTKPTRAILMTFAAAATAVVVVIFSVVCQTSERNAKPAGAEATPTPAAEEQQGPVGLGQPTIADLRIKLAYARVGETGTGTLVIHLPNREPADVAGASGVFTGISWSPNGQRIAFSVGPTITNQDLYVVAGDGTGVARLTTDGHSKRPTWSADGETLAFVSYVPGATPGPGAITLMPASGGAPRQLTAELADNPSWSPDGASIAVSREPGVVTLISPTDGFETKRIVLLNDSVSKPSTSSFVWNGDGSALTGVLRKGQALAVFTLADELTAQRQVGTAFLGNPVDTAWPHPSWAAGTAVLVVASPLTGQLFALSAEAPSKAGPSADPDSLVVVLLDPPLGTKLAYPAVSPVATGGGASSSVKYVPATR